MPQWAFFKYMQDERRPQWEANASGEKTVDEKIGMWKLCIKEKISKRRQYIRSYRKKKKETLFFQPHNSSPQPRSLLVKKSYFVTQAEAVTLELQSLGKIPSFL